MLSRIVRVINVSIAVLIVLIALAVYWYAVRPLPKTSGDIEAPISSSAKILRDERGIPHIQAQSWQDAIFLQGYATAQDRLWQMDSLRRFGAGELSEVFGASALPVDERSRAMRMSAIAQGEVAKMRPADRAIFVEYARGVNYYIDTHHGDYSLEFALPGHEYDPRPWTLTDSALIGLVMFRDMTDESRFEFDKGLLLTMADPAKVMALFPANRGQYLSPGSNAWAVSGNRSADGKPMAANDPHLAYGIPGTWHLVQLKAPGLDVSGAALPGVPGVITGHNQQIAWGVTNLGADVLDLYNEQIDERTGRYVFQGAVQQAQLDRQFIRVRNGQTRELNTWVTRHGPVIMHEHGKSLSMRWSATDGFGFPFLDVNRAQNWEQFRAALSVFWGPGQNFVYADRAGNIGYQATGRVPIRQGFTGDVPLDGSSGKFEWAGYIPYEQMPSIYNPASGIVATANQNPFPPDFPYSLGGDFADPYRVIQIRALLGSKTKLTVTDMLAVQKDVYSAYNFFLAQRVKSAYAKYGTSNQLASEALAILDRWSGQMEKDEAAPMITSLLDRNLESALIRAALTHPAKAAGSAGSQFPPNVPEIVPRPWVIEELLQTHPHGWIANDDWDQWIRQNFEAALLTGRAGQGTPVAKWRWGRMLEWNLQHPVGKQIPLLNTFFDIGPVEMSGSGTTVKQTTRTLGPSERMVVDLGDLDHSVQNLPVGESGSVASRHYTDQWTAYYAGKSFSMEFDKVDAKETLQVRPAR